MIFKCVGGERLLRWRKVACNCGWLMGENKLREKVKVDGRKFKILAEDCGCSLVMN